MFGRGLVERLQLLFGGLQAAAKRYKGQVQSVLAFTARRTDPMGRVEESGFHYLKADLCLLNYQGYLRPRRGFAVLPGTCSGKNMPCAYTRTSGRGVRLGVDFSFISTQMSSFKRRIHPSNVTLLS